MPLSRNPSAIQWTSLETAAYILSSTKISEVASRRCTGGVTQLKTGKFGGSQRMRAESAEGRLTVPVRQRSPYPKFGVGEGGGGDTQKIPADNSKLDSI